MFVFYFPSEVTIKHIIVSIFCLLSSWTFCNYKSLLILTVVCSTEDAEVIYRDATTLDLVDSGYAWIVTEQALLPHNTPIGCVLSPALPTEALFFSVTSVQKLRCFLTWRYKIR